jgi:ubiquinone/menaquinone biosynthesis C-methylase UbiE
MHDDDAVRQEERLWQDRQGGDLQEGAFERPGTRLVLLGQFERITHALELSAGMRVLDLGCGVGHFLGWVTDRAGVQGYGADLSIGSLARARAASPALRLAAADAESLPFQDKSFDRVVCNGSAHHFLDNELAFRELHRVVKPGGIVVLHEPTASGVTSGLRRLFLRNDTYESPADLAHKEEFTAARAVEALAEAGFADIRTSFHDFLAYPLSGNYVDLPFGRSRRVSGLLWRVEQRLARQTALGRLWASLSWRLLVVATRPDRYQLAR